MDILWQYQFRIILLGDSTVGKSSLLKRFTDGIYSDVADPTVGVDFYARSLDIEPGIKLNFSFGIRLDRNDSGKMEYIFILWTYQWIDS